jgi:hypothetical protein
MMNCNGIALEYALMNLFLNCERNENRNKDRSYEIQVFSGYSRLFQAKSNESCSHANRK